jgi:hypothetical protein
VGLLLLRLVAGGSVVHGAIGHLHGEPFTSTVLEVLTIGNALLLLAGIWTPVAGCLATLFALRHALGHPVDIDGEALLAGIGAALALVGPGAWSLDAWLFGWKRIDIED